MGRNMKQESMEANLEVFAADAREVVRLAGLIGDMNGVGAAV